MLHPPPNGGGAASVRMWLSASLFGGSAEYVELWFKSVGREAYFYWYVALVCAVPL